MKVRHVPNHWIIEEAHRLDCSPFTSGGIEAKKTIESLSSQKSKLVDLTLGGIDGIYHVGQEKIQWVSSPDYGIPFLRSADIVRSLIPHALRINREQVKANPLFQCPAGTTLITRSGTIGRTAYARKEIEDVAISQDVLKVVPDTSKIRPGYLYAYLASRFGMPQIISGTFGSIIVHIEAENISGLLVPCFEDGFEEQIHKLIDESSRFISEHQLDVETATSMLFSACSIPNLACHEWHEMPRDLGFDADFPNVESFRALNFNPRFRKLSDRISNGDHLTLAEVCHPGTLKRGNRFRRIDADNGHGYQLVGQKQLFWLQPQGRWISKHFVSPDVLAAEGTILVAVQGTLGESELYCRPEFVWKPWTRLAFSEHILRVQANEKHVLPGCLFAFLRSETAFRMLRAISNGTKLQEPHHKLLGRLPIPIPDTKTQDSIHSLIVSAYEKRHRAVSLIEQAIRLVEERIQGEAL